MPPLPLIPLIPVIAGPSVPKAGSKGVTIFV